MSTKHRQKLGGGELGARVAGAPVPQQQGRKLVPAMVREVKRQVIKSATFNCVVKHRMTNAVTWNCHPMSNLRKNLVVTPDRTIGAWSATQATATKSWRSNIHVFITFNCVQRPLVLSLMCLQ